MKSPDSSAFQKFRGEWIERGLSDHDLSDGAFRVLACLAHRFLNREKRSCWPAQETIAEAAGMKVRTVQKHLSELQERGHIKIKRQGRDKPNIYIPAFYDAQDRADHNVDDTHECADHQEPLTRNFRSGDPQDLVSMTRTNLRTNPLKEPFEEHRAVGPLGAEQPDTVINDELRSDQITPASAPLKGAAVASPAIFRATDDPVDFFFDLGNSEPFAAEDSEAARKIVDHLVEDLAEDERTIARKKLHRLLSVGELTRREFHKIIGVPDGEVRNG